MFFLTSKGDFKTLERYLMKSLNNNYRSILEKYGQQGVQALSAATPVDTGKTASSWDYRITEKNGNLSVEWINTNVNDGVNIAVILQYGHGTGTGGYVVGTDYINPALKSVFDGIAEAAWKEVTSI
jgi:hypothetical protein